MMTVSLMIVTLVVSFGIISFSNIGLNIETQMANSAMDYAKTLATLDTIKEGLALQKPYNEIALYVESLRIETRYQYIIVMDMEGIQYSYPYQSGIGKKYKNGGESNVLKYGQAEKSADRNELISAIRAFAPVFYNGEQVGAVLVGLLTDEVQQELTFSYRNIQVTLVVFLFIGFIVAYVLSKNIKKSIFGLEPKEIALLTSEKTLIFNSIHQGMLAVDKMGTILDINQVAQEILSIDANCIGTNISEYNLIVYDYILNVINIEKNTSEEVKRLNSRVKLVLRTSLMRDPNNNIVGAVTNIELFSQVREIAEKLTNYEDLIDSLRAQSHEFSNKLHTVSGLIQIQAYDEAIEYIDDISIKDNVIHSFIRNNIKDNKVSGLLLAKYNHIIEDKINLEFSEDSIIEGFPNKMDPIIFCSILGNLLDNSREAILNCIEPAIFVRILSNEDHCYIEIYNNGPIISEDESSQIFKKYYTSKKNGNGVGLYILQKEIEALNGSIEFKNTEGVTWYVNIPK